MYDVVFVDALDHVDYLFCSPRQGDKGMNGGSPRDRSRSPVKTSKVDLSEDVKRRVEELYDDRVVKKGEIGEGFFDALGELQENEQIYVLDRIKVTDFSRVRTVEGFCVGIIRRVKDFGMEDAEPDFTILGEEVKERLEKLIADGKFERSDIDLRVVRTMKKLGEEDRKVALDRYEDSLDDSIRSKQGFFMGIVKRLLPQRPGGGRGRGRGGGRGGHRRYQDDGRNHRYGHRDHHREYSSRYDRY